MVDVSLHDQISLGIDTCVLVNWPKPAMASLPVSLVVSIVDFSSTVCFFVYRLVTRQIRIEIEPSTDQSPPMLSFSFMDACSLSIEVKSLLGHRTKIKDLPKLTSMISRRIRTLFMERLVWPSVQRIPLPFVKEPL